MSVRQYIGARYVPRFLGTWNNTTQYEALDVVDNGSGTSYIARKIVPPGTPLTNTDFWFVYGASSGAILNLQTRMNAAESDIDELDSISSSIINNLKGSDEPIVFIGDSFGDNICASLSGTYGYTHITSNNVGGEGFIGGGFLNQLNAVEVTEPSEIKYVICIGGTNDTSSSASGGVIAPLVKAFCQRAAERFPNARIMIGYVCALNRTTDDTRFPYKSYCKGQYQLGTSYSGVNAEFIDNLCEALGCAWVDLDTDRVHPTPVGYTKLANIISQAIRRQNMSMADPAIIMSKSYNFTMDSKTCTINCEFYSDGHGNLLFHIPYQVMYNGTIAVSGATIYTLIAPENLPILPPFAQQKHVVIGSGKFAAVRLAASTGLTFFYDGANVIDGSYPQLKLYDSLDFVIPMF